MTKRRDKKPGDYEIGWKKPPRDTQFKPGNRAAATNGKARRRRAASLDQMLAKVLARSTIVRLADGTKQRRLNLDLIAQHIFKMALSPEPRQAGMAIRLLREINPILEDPASKSIKVEFVRPDGSLAPSFEPYLDHPPVKPEDTEEE